MTAGRAGAAVWLLALGQTLIYAGSYYAFPALLPDLLAETGWSEAQLALGPTLAFLVMAVGTPLTGRLVDRGLGGELLIWAPVVAALALAGLSLADRPAVWIGLWLVIGAAQAGMLYETCFAFLTRRLGAGARAAITRVTLVAGLAGTLAFPLGHWLGDVMGGRGALVAFAGLLLMVAVPANALAVRWLRQGTRAGADRAPPPPGVLMAALRRPVFWGIAGTFALIWLNHTILITYVLVLFAERGAAEGAATLAAACIGPAQVLGRIVLMMNEARIGNAPAVMGALGAVVLASLVLWMAGAAPGLIFAFAVLQGAGAGVLSILRPVLTAERLGHEGFGVISGAIAVAPILASALGPSVGAWALAAGGAQAVYALVTGLALAGLALGGWLAATGPRP